MYVYSTTYVMCFSLYFQVIFVNDEYSVELAELKDMIEVSKLSLVYNNRLIDACGYFS